MSYATIEDLRSQLGGSPAPSAAYAAKMLHDLPKASVVDRTAFILKHCAGKSVIEFGASGKLSQAIRDVAKEYRGVDREFSDGVYGFDLDDVSQSHLPPFNRSADIIICGEVIEHLSNPGWFLTRLHREHRGTPVILTTPNAYNAVSQKWVARGKENVNIDHVAWYSPTTLATLLTRSGFTVGDFFYYNGDGPTAEGLIVCAE